MKKIDETPELRAACEASGWSSPPFALERLELLDAERVVYRLPKPQRDGTTALTLTSLELIDQLAA